MKETKVTIPWARCQDDKYAILILSEGKANFIQHGLDDRLIFWIDTIIAAKVGGVLYHHVPTPTSAITKLLYKQADHMPMVAATASDFDFIVGSFLTRVGLSLTRAPSQEKANA